MVVAHPGEHLDAHSSPAAVGAEAATAHVPGRGVDETVAPSNTVFNFDVASLPAVEPAVEAGSCAVGVHALPSMPSLPRSSNVHDTLDVGLVSQIGLSVEDRAPLLDIAVDVAPLPAAGPAAEADVRTVDVHPGERAHSSLAAVGAIAATACVAKARLVFALFLVVPCPVLGGRRGRAGGRIFQLSGNRHKGAKSVASRVDATFPHEFDHFPRVERPGGRFRGFDGNCGKSDFSIRESLTKVRSSFP